MLDLAADMGIRPRELGRWAWVEVAALFQRRADLAAKRAKPAGNLLDLDAQSAAAAFGATS